MLADGDCDVVVFVAGNDDEDERFLTCSGALICLSFSLNMVSTSLVYFVDSELYHIELDSIFSLVE